MVCGDRCVFPFGNVGGSADVVGTEVCQHQVPQVRQLVPLWRIESASRESGIDETQPVGVVPQVRVHSRQSDEGQWGRGAGNWRMVLRPGDG